jgi:hypothetical protein
MLVYSKGQIIIDGHLVYACPPEDILRCHDYLGLVSELDIQIAPLSITGAGDLFINAAIFAKGRFCVANIYEGSGAVLHIFGSLSAGSVSATEPRFATKIFFDQRLKHYRPPYFPMTDHFEIVAWDRQWRIRESTL